ncbi:MAG: nucleotide exchange factor GrpE [Candidatus Omnitrophota bacterium]
MEKEHNKHKKEEEKQEEIKETVTISLEEFNELKAKADEAKDYFEKFARLQAEFENTKKRLLKEKEEFIKFANDELLLRVIPVLDNFRRAVENTHEEHSVADVLAGIKLIDKQLEEVLKDFGLSVIDAMGKKFDPHYHEAVLHEETDEYEEDTVIGEFQSGYLLNGRLLRPALVKVAKKKVDSE